MEAQIRLVPAAVDLTTTRLVSPPHSEPPTRPASSGHLFTVEPSPSPYFWIRWIKDLICTLIMIISSKLGDSAFFFFFFFFSREGVNLLSQITKLTYIYRHTYTSNPSPTGSNSCHFPRHLHVPCSILYLQVCIFYSSIPINVGKENQKRSVLVRTVTHLPNQSADRTKQS